MKAVEGILSNIYEFQVQPDPKCPILGPKRGQNKNFQGLSTKTSPKLEITINF